MLIPAVSPTAFGSFGRPQLLQLVVFASGVTLFISGIAKLRLNEPTAFSNVLGGCLVALSIVVFASSFNQPARQKAACLIVATFSSFLGYHINGLFGGSFGCSCLPLVSVSHWVMASACLGTAASICFLLSERRLIAWIPAFAISGYVVATMLTTTNVAIVSRPVELRKAGRNWHGQVLVRPAKQLSVLGSKVSCDCISIQPPSRDLFENKDYAFDIEVRDPKITKGRISLILSTGGSLPIEFLIPRS